METQNIVNAERDRDEDYNNIGLSVTYQQETNVKHDMTTMFKTSW